MTKYSFFAKIKEKHHFAVIYIIQRVVFAYDSSEEINRIRNDANIVDIISSYINLEPKGKTFGLCPFHED